MPTTVTTTIADDVKTPVDRGYRIMASAYAAEMLAEGFECEPKDNDRVMALRHLARSIQEQAQALVEALEHAEMAAERVAERTGKPARSPAEV
jgi:hypothetical protein